jgi:hypothetical protein
MSVPPELDTLLQRWRELTEAEAGAIRVGDWTAVAREQSEKQSLQAEISRAMDRDFPLPPRLKATVAQLKSMERRNAALIAEQRRLAWARREEMDSASRNLRRLGRSYASGPVSYWQSYS